MKRRRRIPDGVSAEPRLARRWMRGRPPSCGSAARRRHDRARAASVRPYHDCHTECRCAWQLPRSRDSTRRWPPRSTATRRAICPSATRSHCCDRRRDDDPADRSAELRREAFEHFSRDELIELTLDVMKWNYQKVPVALGVDAEVRPGELAELAFDASGRPSGELKVACGSKPGTRASRGSWPASRCGRR